MSFSDELTKLIEITRNHNKWRRFEAINLIASENVMSPLAEYVYLNDMMYRYAEGLPGDRYYCGTKYIDEIEVLTLNLMSKLFNSKFVDLRPISGTLANVATYLALAKPGDVIASLPLSKGGHISHRKIGAPGLLGFKIIDLPWSNEEFNIDVDKAIKVIKEYKPKLVIVGTSLYLFPHPVKELVDVVHEVNGYLIHDSAHVLGLIAGKVFPNPLDQGCDVMTASTHKTFPGPQGGVVFCNNEEIFAKIQKAVSPGLTSNYHLHRYAATAVTAIEMFVFGEEYAKQIIKNAKKLAEELYNLGFKVVAENKGFTQTHQVAIDVSNLGGGEKCSKLLEQANIIVNKNELPWDKSSKNPSGIRIGVQEVTRFGMKEVEMEIIAQFIADVLLRGKSIDKVRQEVINFRKEYTEVKYGFSLKEFGFENNLRLLI